MQIVASLCAYITPRSLVVIDEPEMHLHPPLLAALMHALRFILEEHKAFCIVATHSPVVLQETLTRHIYVVRREGSTFDAQRCPIETFGENVGALTSEIFGLTTEVTDYHKTLDKAIAQYASLEPIEALFAPHGLSRQGRAYVMSRLRARSSN
jgi:predicted ATP-binding protein involved in virulence